MESTKSELETTHWPATAAGYELIGPVGQGSYGLVWKAVCRDKNSQNNNLEVAIKIVDLELFQDGNMDDIRKEIQIMSQCSHKNVISYYVSFIDDSDLWLVMPLLGAGSVHDVIDTKFKEGIKDEVLIATIMKEVVQGLLYFHEQGQIHRDIKSGNILMDEHANTYLSDFGVSAHHKPGQKRQTFVGSPCWMAPEVMEQQDGYDIKADIWSLGITAIEIAEGDAPNAELPAMRVLLQIINSPPPQLNRDNNWSQEFKDFVNACLQKTPNQRPSCQELLDQHKKFFDKAKDQTYIKTQFLKDLKPLTERKSKVLDQQGEEYKQKVAKRKSKKEGKKLKKQTTWDFSSGGDQSHIKKEALNQKITKNQSEVNQNKQLSDDDFDYGIDEKESS